MKHSIKETVRKKAVKGILVFLEILAFSLFCFTASWLILAESEGFWFTDLYQTYEESRFFDDNVCAVIWNIVIPDEREAWQNEEDQPVSNRYQEGNTNLTYLIVDPKDKKILSNHKEYNSYEKSTEYLNEFRQKEWFMIIRDCLQDCEGAKSKYNLDLLMTVQEKYGSGSILAVTMDLEYPIADAFQRGLTQYRANQSYALPCMIGCLVSAFLSLACLILLTIGAGRKPGDDQIYLHKFDSFYTEPSALVIFCIWCTGCFPVLEEFLPSYEEKWNMIILLTVEGTFTIFCFLIGYLSLVRRIKAKKLWERSILNVGKHGLYKIWKLLCKYPLAFLRKCYTKGRKAGKYGMIFIKAEFLDHLGDLTKLCLLLGFLLVLRFCMYIAAGDSNLYIFLLFILILMDLAIAAGILFYLGCELRIKNGLKKIASGEMEYKIETKGLLGYQKEMADSVNQIGDGIRHAVQESLKNERMKTELITNVSHDIKTPLTSIINYIDLMKREEIQDPKIQGYLSILEEKAQRLKVLTEDVVEASKASTGNITLEMAKLDFVELIQQAAGEYEEKLKEHQLHSVYQMPETPVWILADGRRMWRILSNLFGNIVKYSLEGTRVYIDLTQKGQCAELVIKNISRESLNITADELTERFVRGDQSRTTEGSGLGLSIAKSFTELMQGSFRLDLDGDLFKVTITFPVMQ